MSKCWTKWGLITPSVLYRSVASSSLLNRMSGAATLWMEKYFANHVISAWSPVKGTTTKTWLILKIFTFKQINNPDCPQFPMALSQCKLPFFLFTRKDLLYFIILHFINWINSCIYAKAELSFCRCQRAWQIIYHFIKRKLSYKNE